MLTFIAAYLCVWGAVAFYVLRLRTRQKELEQHARELEQQLKKLEAASFNQPTPPTDASVKNSQANSSEQKAAA